VEVIENKGAILQCRCVERVNAGWREALKGIRGRVRIKLTGMGREFTTDASMNFLSCQLHF
jgi:hypothetical protein